MAQGSPRVILLVIAASVALGTTALAQTAFTVQNRSVADFAVWAATGGVRVLTGDFNGDGGTDLALVRQTSGWTTVPVALSTATGFVIQNRPVGGFAGWATAPGVQVLTGDFNGDGRTDIGLVRQSPGWTTVPVALSSDTAFTIQNRPAGTFAGWATASSVEVVTGDFNNDGRTDVGLVRQTSGWTTVPVALSGATAFTIQNRPVGDFAVWAATGGVRVITGDFGGDDGTDIGLVRQTSGWNTVPVALSTGSGFTIQNRPAAEFAGWATAGGVKVITGDFDADGLTDVGLVRQASGWNTVPVALASASGFSVQNRRVGDFATWAATGGVQVVTGDFNDDGNADVGLVRQASGWTTAPVALSGDANHRLQVRRFTTSVLTNANADTILADATAALRISDGAGDTACACNLTRNGNVTAFAAGDGSIDSEAEFDALLGVAGHVKVVNQINWCGALVPNVIGCAPVPGESLAVVRFTANQEGILWAHEFGHNKGRSHRNDPNAIMNATIGATRRRVTAVECDAFLTPTILAPEAAVPPGVPMPQEMSVREFVRQVFVHGVPYEEATRYGSAAVPELLEMLGEPAEEAYWANVVVVLGMIGDDAAVAPIIAFIEKDDEGGRSRERYAAKTSALMALGYLINKTGNRRALDYLKASLDPQVWAPRGVRVMAPFQASTSERNRDLSKHAILGLAVSGRPEAAEALRALQTPGPAGPQRAFRAAVGDLVSEALQEHEKVASQGLAEYHRRRRK